MGGGVLEEEFERNGAVVEGEVPDLVVAALGEGEDSGRVEELRGLGEVEPVPGEGRVWR